MAQPAKMPSFEELMWATLGALESLGGSASIRELDDSVSTNLGLTDDILDVLHGDGPQTEFANRCGWARTRLRSIGAVENSARGVWTVTESGRRIGSPDRMRELLRRQRREYRSGLRNAREEPNRVNDLTEESSEEESWQAALLEILRKMEPDAFERLCQRLLREHGFTRVEVTGRSGDGGIDGTGVLRVNLLSFHVNYQCKRYSGTVGPGSIRDFRGALAGRADKGLFITTGRFTKDAEREAVRDGAMAIDLIDGVELCRLLREKELGVITETVERVTPDSSFFDAL
ncbi:MAG: restriction endonuclease [Chloroflexota bacterium]|nr:restriction endonuclease [Chloroflexota bacterium]